MLEPATKLDARFSEPDSAPTPWSETTSVLDAAELFWITTVRRDGRPHVSPLVAVWLDDTLYFSTGETEQKAVNLEANPHVILTTGCNTWDHGLDVVAEGAATRVTDNALLRQLASAWATKWDGRWRYEAGSGMFHHPGGGGALVYALTPRQGARLWEGHLHPHQLPLHSRLQPDFPTNCPVEA